MFKLRAGLVVQGITVVRSPPYSTDIKEYFHQESDCWFNSRALKLEAMVYIFNIPITELV